MNGDADLSRRCIPYDVQGIILPNISLEELL